MNGREIVYLLERKKVKNINLRIKADRSIHVSAAARVSDKVIENFLISKTDFILKALDHYASVAENAPKPKEYISGEQFMILGKKRELSLIAGNRNSVEIDDSRIILTVKDPCDPALKKKVMDQWMKNYCKELILAVCKSVYPSFAGLGIDFPEIRFRKMTSRWGSCQPMKKVLTFNLALIEAPLPCIEYVTAHEFAHFLQPNHSKHFYANLSAVMPDWKDRKRLLNHYGTAL